MQSKDILKNMLRFCVPTIVSAIVSIFVLPLISHICPEEEYGYISNFYSIGNMLMGLVFLGADQAYIRYFNEPPKSANRNGVFLFSLFVGICMTLSLFLIVTCLFPYTVSDILFGEKALRGVILLEIYVLALVGYRVSNINYRFTNNAKAYNIQQVCYILGNRLLFSLAFIYSTRYIYSALVMVAVMLALASASLLHQKEYFYSARIDKKAKRELMSFALPLMPSGVLVLVNNSVAKLVLGGYGMRGDVGILAVATSAANIFSTIPNSFSVFWGAFFYKYYQSEQNRIKVIHDLIMLLSVFLVAGVVIFQNDIYKLLGADYRSSQEYFMLIMLSPITNLLSETTVYGISLANKTKYTLFTSILGLFVNVAVCFLLIPHYGALGAALGVAMSSLLIFVLRSLIAQRYYTSIISKHRTITAVVMIVVLCAGNIYFSSHIAARLIAVLCVCAMVFVLYHDLLLNCISHLYKVIFISNIFRQRR